MYDDTTTGSARAQALAMLERILGDGATIAEVETGDQFAGLSQRDRAYTRLLLATALRRRGQLDHVIAGCLRKPLGHKQSKLQNLLRLGAVQLLFLDTPPYAAIDSMVTLARTAGLAPFAGLTNAVLRRIDRERAPLLDERTAGRDNTPDWLWQSWCAAYGEATTEAVARAHLVEPPLDLTLCAPDAAHPEGVILPTGSLRRPTGGKIADLPGYADGSWWVQDAAAALPARLLGDIAGGAVVDLCAAPGGKTAQLAAAGADVTAVDIDPDRLQRVATNLARLRLSADLVVADVATWRPASPPAAILLDAPCTATGTIRRHPDILHRRTPDHLAAATRAQAKLLRAAAAMLPVGGVLVYAVCSLQPEEGPQQIAGLLAADPALTRVPVTATELAAPRSAAIAADTAALDVLITAAGDLRTLPCHFADLGGMDGFYACRLRRR